MPTPDSTSSIKRMAAFRKSPAGRTCGASSTTCNRRTLRRLPARLWNESRHCMPSRKRSAAGHRTSGNRFAQTRARPLLQSLRDWFEVSLTKLSRKSDTTAAIRYALGLWPALTRYCDDGRLEIDNNAAERALRAVALGRKNYLFAGSDTGGERAAAIYSLIGRRNSTAWIRKPICARCCRASPITPSTASRSCCLGTSPQTCRP